MKKLCRKAPCSVVLLPPGARTRPEGEQVAVDFSDYSKEALQVGATLARGLSIAGPRAIHAWWVPESDMRAPLPYEELRPLIERSAKRRLSDFVAGTAPSDLSWSSVLIEAPLACTATLDASKERPADLLVISHRGEDAVIEGLLGSTAAELVRRIESPCLVVKRKGTGLWLLRDLPGLSDRGATD